MECSDIQKGLSSFVERYDSQTFIGSYRETTRASLLKDGLSTRANSLWKMAEYVIAEFDNNTNASIDSYLNGWKVLASRMGNQYLLLEESKGSWGLYDSQGVKIGDTEYIKKWLSKQTAKHELKAESMEPQTVFFGAPGTGKSYAVKQIVAGKDYIRTTFHPDTDYASFVGCYKPTKSLNSSSGITYSFVPQAFVNAYIKAWTSFKPFYLVIEEINRGNCAQIFGDIFQLLDRDAETGESSYEIEPDTDLQACLKENFDKVLKSMEDDIDIRERVSEDILSGRKMKLPSNLFLLATMNTSDQSLFPMDSAFKRRWSWKYVPIETDCPQSQFRIKIGDKVYKWASFLEKANEKVHRLSDSEDKQMGNFFIKSNIEEDEFKSKVMFYLWSEICKDYEKAGSFFKYIGSEGNEVEFTFNTLFPTNDKTNKILQGFMSYLNVEKDEDATAKETKVTAFINKLVEIGLSRIASLDISVNGYPLVGSSQPYKHAFRRIDNYYVQTTVEDKEGMIADIESRLV